jgi:hypothetical protein
MRPNRLLSSLAATGLLLGVVGAFVASGSAGGASPTISATPNRQLVDGQQVTVSESGFAPSTEMAIIECPTATVSPSACDLGTLVFADTDANGAVSDVPFNVARTLGDGTDCVTNGGCYIGTQAGDGTGPTAATLVKFNLKVPPFVLKVLVDKTDTVNAKGVVAVKGTIVCQNGSAIVDVNLTLSQVVHRAIFTAFGFVEAACTDGTPVPFRATVRPQNGLFGPGAATVFADGFANAHETAHKVAVTLVAQ